MPHFRDQSKKLGIALNTNYIAIVACRFGKTWPKGIAARAGVNNIAALKPEFVQGAEPVSLALSPGVSIHSPFENTHEESLRLLQRTSSGVSSNRSQAKVDNRSKRRKL
jgi:hypothetical protein